MDKRLFFLLNMAQHRVFKYADQGCEQVLGISVTQAAALLFIAKHEACLQKDLSQALGLNNPAVTGLAGRMEKKGLIRRQPCDQDGRAMRIYLTELGKGKLPEIFPMLQKINDKLMADFSEDEIGVVLRFFNKVMQTFD